MANETKIPLVVEAVKSAINQTFKDLDLTKEKIENISKSGKKTNDVFSGLSKTLKGVFTIAAVKQASGLALETSKLAGQFENLRRSLDNLAKKEGIDAQQLLVDLRSASRDTLSEIQLLKTSTLGKFLGIELKNMPTLLEFAAKRARETGEDIRFLTDSLIVGIGRKSILRLDNLGIQMQNIRDEVKNILVETGKWTGAISDNVIQMHFQEAAIRVAQKGIMESGEQIDSTADKLSRMNAQWENFKVALGQLIAGPAGNALDTLSSFLKTIARDIRGAEGLKELSREFKILKDTFGTQDQELEKLIPRYEQLKSRTNLSRQEQDELNKVVKRIAEIIPSSVSAVDDYGKALDINLVSVQNYLKAQRELLKITERDNFTKVATAIRDNREQLKTNNEEFEKFNKELDELIKKDPEEVFRSISVPAFGTTGADKVIETVGQRIKQVREEISNLGVDSKTAGVEFDSLVFALSNFVDLAEITPEKLVAQVGALDDELKITDQTAQLLINRFKELSKITPDRTKPSDPDPDPNALKREKALAEFKRRIALELAVVTAETELKAEEEKLAGERDAKIRHLAGILEIEKAHLLTISELKKTLANENNAELEQIDKIHQDKLAVLREETFTKAQEKIKQQLEEFFEFEQEIIEANQAEIEQSFLAIGSIIESTATNLATGLADAATRGSEDWKNFFNDLKKQIVSFLASQAVKALLNFVASALTGGAAGNLFGSVLPGLGQILGFQSGGVIKGSPQGHIVRVGENNTDEVIIPISKLRAPFGRPASLSPGLPSIPPPTLPAVANAGGGSVFNTINNTNNVPIGGRIVLETADPGLARVRDFYMNVGNDIIRPEFDRQDTFLRTKDKSEFDG